jgi:hypothetical protein
MESAALASGLTRQAAQLAPVALAPIVVLHALSAGSASASAALIAKGTAKAMSAAYVKLAGAVVVGVAIVAGGATVLKSSISQLVPVAQTATPAGKGATATAPAMTPSPLWRPTAINFTPMPNHVEFRNAAMLVSTGSNVMDYSVGVDASVVRTPGDPAGFIASINANPTGSCARGWFAIAQMYRGKRVRLSAWLKTEDVSRFAGIQLGARDGDGRMLHIDSFGTPLMRATSDWTRCYAVVDVPADAERIEFCGILFGPGKIWTDAFQLEVVPPAVPVTSDDQWRLIAPFGDCELISDSTQPRNGHATACIASAITATDHWGMLRLMLSDLDRFRGKKLRMSAMIKCEGVRMGSLIATVISDTELSTPNSGQAHRPVRGTAGWLKYSVVVDVPEETTAIETGIILNGGGKIWVDDVTFEPVAQATSATARR